jgi:hypothetical protein
VLEILPGGQIDHRRLRLHVFAESPVPGAGRGVRNSAAHLLTEPADALPFLQEDLDGLDHRPLAAHELEAVETARIVHAL